MGEKEGANIGLLGINGSRGKITWGRRLATVDRGNVSSSSGGTSTANAALAVDSTTLDETNVSVLVDTNVGAVDNQAASIGRDVVSHGSKGDDSTKGESSKATHGKVVTVGGGKILLQNTVHLVAAKGSGKEGAVAISVAGESTGNLRDEFGVGDGTGECLGDILRNLLDVSKGYCVDVCEKCVLELIEYDQRFQLKTRVSEERKQSARVVDELSLQSRVVLSTTCAVLPTKA